MQGDHGILLASAALAPRTTSLRSRCADGARGAAGAARPRAPVTKRRRTFGDPMVRQPFSG